MKFSLISLAVPLLLETPDRVMADWQQKESSVFKDDQSYWSRLLGTEQGSLSPAPIPATPPPASRPPLGSISIGCVTHVDVECIPPEGFSDCNIGELPPDQSRNISVYFDFKITNFVGGYDATVETLYVATNFDPPNDMLNYTEDVRGILLGPSETLPLSSGPFTIDLSIRKTYIISPVAEMLSVTGEPCSDDTTLNFTAGVALP